MVVPHGKRAEACYILSQGTVDDGSGGGSGCKITGNPRITPSGRRVPKILNGWIVVEIQAVNQFLAAELRRVRITNIGVVAAEMVILRVVGHLHEATDVRCPSPRKEKRNVLRKFKTAILGSGNA